MLRSPYPTPPSRWYTATLVTGWLVGGLTIPWIIRFPPVPYEGMGLVASYGWGVMVGVGSILVAYAHWREDYRAEIPGIGIFLGGLVVYMVLSWDQVFSGSPGTGVRALMLVPFAATELARSIRLWAYHRKMKPLQRLARGADGVD